VALKAFGNGSKSTMPSRAVRVCSAAVNPDARVFVNVCNSTGSGNNDVVMLFHME
jgi:hypothetical protein